MTMPSSPPEPLRFLLVTSTFPPRGGSSVQRAAKFSKYAARFGGEPVVLTTSYEGRFADPSLVAELPDALEVHRVCEEDRPSLLGRLFPAKTIFRFPDEYRLFRREAVRQGLKLAGERKLDAIFVSYGAISALVAGDILSRRTGFPLMIDIRDFKRKRELSGQDILRPRPVWSHFVGRLERRAFQRASRFTVVSEHYRDMLAQHYGVPRGKIDVIYNGYDPEDFPAGGDADTPTPDAVLRYFGFVNNRGSFENLMRALAVCNAARTARGEPPVRIEVVGGNDVADLAAVSAQAGVGEACVFRPYTPHGEVVSMMTRSAGLLLLPHGEPGVVPGKFCEYVGAGRPIVLLDSGNPELRGLVERLSLGAAAPSEDIAAVADILDRAADLVIGREGREAFRRDLQARAFMAALRRVVDSQGAID